MVPVATDGTGTPDGTPRTGGSGEPGQVVAVFSPKGGVGRTTVAVNLAIAAATELGKKVVIMDASFQFGDVGVLLNLNPKSKSIADLIPELDTGDARLARHVPDQPHRRRHASCWRRRRPRRPR